MKGKTHAKTSLAMSYAFAGFCFVNNPGVDGLIMGISLGLGVFAGGLYPDIDNEDSAISRDSIWLEDALDHRGYTHTLANVLFVGISFYLLKLLLAAIFAFSFNFLVCIGVGLSIGCLWHMILDTLTPKGIMWLWPFSIRHFRIPIVSNTKKTAIEPILCTIFTVVFAVLGGILFSKGAYLLLAAPSI